MVMMNSTGSWRILRVMKENIHGLHSFLLCEVINDGQTSIGTDSCIQECIFLVRTIYCGRYSANGQNFCRKEILYIINIIT